MDKTLTCAFIRVCVLLLNLDEKLCLGCFSYLPFIQEKCDFCMGKRADKSYWFTKVGTN